MHTCNIKSKIKSVLKQDNSKVTVDIQGFKQKATQ